VEDPGFESRQGKIFSFSPKPPDRLWGPHSLLYIQHRSEANRPGRVALHSPPYSVQGKNDGSKRLLPLYVLMAQTGTPLPFKLFFFSEDIHLTRTVPKPVKLCTVFQTVSTAPQQCPGIETLCQGSNGVDTPVI
jgi:hypothetical protein